MTTSQHPADKSTSTPIGAGQIMFLCVSTCAMRWCIYSVEIRSTATLFFLMLLHESKVVQE